jgi:hypothetical protein
MGEVHLSASELELFVIGALGNARAAAVEAHVGACERCAAALAREARVEMTLDEIANAAVTRDLSAPRPAAKSTGLAPRKPRPAARSLAITAAGSLSLAAAVLLLLVPSRHVRGPTASGPPAEVRASAAQDAATARALDAMATIAYDQLDGG